MAEIMTANGLVVGLIAKADEAAKAAPAKEESKAAVAKAKAAVKSAKE